MLSGAGKSFKDEDIGVSYTDFPRGSTVFVFNLTSDLSDGLYFDLILHGNIQLQAWFKANLEADVSGVVHVEYDSVIKIDKKQNCLPDYNV